MARVVVLGGSFAGVAAARELRRQLPDRCRVVLVSDRPHLVYRPALPWLLVGQRRPADLTVPLLPRLARHGVEFVEDRVEGIDRKAGHVRLQRSGRIPYDYLLVALGAEEDRCWPGADRTLSILWPEQALQAQRLLASLPSRQASVAVVLGPAAPLICAAYETVLLLHNHLKRQGLRSRTALHLVTAEPRPFDAGGTAASAVVARWLQQTGVHFHPSREPALFEPGRLILKGGEVIPADRVILFPPYRGPRCLRGLDGLLDASGFVAVTRSMRSVGDERIFAAGDVISAPGPKTAHLAENQGRVAARALARVLRGRPPTAAFDSRLVCLMDGGGLRRGLLLMRRPKPGEGESRTLFAFSGPVPRYLKQLFERYFLRFGV